MEQIKLYRREIRPMLYDSGLQGFPDKKYPLLKDDSWFSEDKEEEIRQKYEPSIKEKHHGWVDLIFDERYVDVGDAYMIYRVENHPTPEEEDNWHWN